MIYDFEENEERLMALSELEGLLEAAKSEFNDSKKQLYGCDFLESNIVDALDEIKEKLKEIEEMEEYDNDYEIN